ncbi:ATPase [Lachnospiraceae bacterium 62-35]
MDNIISKISEIEASASSIMDSAGKQKQILAKEMEARIAAFDADLEQRTSAELDRLRSGIEREMKTQLFEQKSRAEKIIAQLQELYDNNHSQYVKDLFDAMVKE